MLHAEVADAGEPEQKDNLKDKIYSMS
jgi:hypothetical protein